MRHDPFRADDPDTPNRSLLPAKSRIACRTAPLSALASILAQTLYDGVSPEPAFDRLIRIENGRVASIDPAPQILPAQTLEAAIVAPGFIDLQINGAADRLFNDEPTVEALEAIAAGARQGGTAHLLPTFITAPGTDYGRALEAVAAAIERRVPGILGIHLEGPFLSPARPGIHPASAIRPMEPADCARIEAFAPMPRLVTLAPEAQDPTLLERLAAGGVRLFAGHSEASAEAMLAATDAGLVGATHLFNAMPPLAGRAPGIVGTAFTDERLFAGIIADGIHVAPMNLALAARLMTDRLCLVTDAMPTLAGRNTGFDLLGTRITLSANRLTGPDGTLAGAHLHMDEAVRNMVALAGVSIAAAIAMASRNPARAMGLGDELGTVAIGYRASFTLLDHDLKAQAVIVDGMIPESSDTA